MSRQRGVPCELGDLLLTHGKIVSASGKTEEARTAWAEAHEIFVTHKDPGAERARELLVSLDRPHLSDHDGRHVSGPE